MRALRSLLMAATAATVALGATTATAAPSPSDANDITVVIDPERADVDLGDSIDLQVTVTNSSNGDRSDLVAHLDVVSPDREGSVDPEDWTATLTRPTGLLAAGASTTIDWTIQPISPGAFLVYGMVLAQDGSDVAPSNVMTVSVTDRRSLNPQGVLPVVIIVPLAVGLLLADRLRRQRT
jgi:hypothetical protein